MIVQNKIKVQTNDKKRDTNKWKNKEPIETENLYLIANQNIAGADENKGKRNKNIVYNRDPLNIWNISKDLEVAMEKNY